MKGFIDITGQKFGRLTVIERAGTNKHKAVLWNCVCDCGNKKIVIGNNLKSGSTESCGCLRKEKARLTAKDITGRRFGRLTVIKRAENSKTRGGMWNCICDCGNKKIYCGRDLRNDHSKSCGCLKKDMLIGNKYKYDSEPIEKRLDKYIDKSSGAWMWIGAVSYRGYGKISYKGEHWSAHRLTYTLFNGEIPEGMCVCHKNDIKLDVTPSNLFLGTNQDNSNDMVNKGRQATGENHGMSKLKEIDVLNIRESFKNGVSAIDLINKFNMDKSTIYDIINRNIWKRI